MMLSIIARNLFILNPPFLVRPEKTVPFRAPERIASSG